MKRVRCPKCDHFILFDETAYPAGQSLIFSCPECGKQFRIRMGSSRLFDKHQKASMQPAEEETRQQGDAGCIVVIENVFHYKQVIPLSMGENVIGRYMKGSNVNCPIETVDPSMDITHCVISVSRDKKGRLKHVLRDGPSNTGTFVDNEILGDKERRVIGHGSLFTIGATSIILKTEAD